MIKLSSRFLLIGGLALLTPSLQANPSLPGGDEAYVEEEIFFDSGTDQTAVRDAAAIEELERLRRRALDIPPPPDSVAVLPDIRDYFPPRRGRNFRINAIDRLGGYMDVSERFIRLAGRPEAAIFFAIEGIVEIYDQRNELALAPPHLQKILDKYPDNKTIRNIVRFRLRDVYNDTGRSDLALRELEAIIAEN